VDQTFAAILGPASQIIRNRAQYRFGTSSGTVSTWIHCRTLATESLHCARHRGGPLGVQIQGDDSLAMHRAAFRLEGWDYLRSIRFRLFTRRARTDPRSWLGDGHALRKCCARSSSWNRRHTKLAQESEWLSQANHGVLSDDPFAPLGTSEPVVTLIDPVATRKSGGLAWQLLSALDAML